MRVLLVGHCVPDRFLLKRAVSKVIPDAEIIDVNTDDDLVQAKDGASLLLVNRVLDGRFEGESGLDLIGALAEEGIASLMLVSNYADAQSEAESRGAAPGIGKSDLHSDEAQARLLSAAQAGKARQ